MVLNILKYGPQYFPPEAVKKLHRLCHSQGEEKVFSELKGILSCLAFRRLSSFLNLNLL